MVITIVILIILATVSINAIFGDNGLIQSAEKGKFEHEKGMAREQIELVLADAYAEKNVNKKEYNENEYLDEFVKERLPEVEIEKEEIGLNGFVFELDRSVPRLGKYIGQVTGPRIKEIKVTGKTTNSASVEVDARNAEGGEYTYLYKKDSEGEENWKEEHKGSEKTYTFNNLEANVIYNIKVKVTTKEGEAEGTVNVLTGEIPEGTVTFENVTWVGDGTASVIINTSELGYTLQYQINGIEEGNWQNTTNGEKISGLHHKDTVYGRIYDGTNGSNEASIEIIDKIAPTVTVQAGGVSTNSITVNVQAVDNESGMTASPTYTYYIKKSTEQDTAYVAKATDVTNTSYTFMGLTQETSYDVKVEVKADKAGNVGIGTLAGQVTTKVPDGGVEEGAITFGTPTWSNGQASVTVNTNTGMQIEYQVNALTEGNWKNIANGGTIGNLQHGQTVYARLTDGTNHGNYVSVSVMDNKEPQNANISLSGTSTSTEESITATVTLVDNESGVNITGSKWIYNTTAENIGTDEGNYNNTFTSNGETLTLKASTTGIYYLHVLTVDKAGNKKETISNAITVTQLVTEITVKPVTLSLDAGDTSQLTVTIKPTNVANKNVTWSSSNSNVASVSNGGLVTAKTAGNATITVRTTDGSNKTASCSVSVKYPTAQSKLKEGDYVIYPSSKGNKTCRVLFDSSSSYGIQIVTDSSVENVTIGSTTFSTAMTEYNNAISTLNSKATTYNNSSYSSSARCVGSLPKNPSSQSGYHTTGFGGSYNNKLRDTDDNYYTDYNKMKSLGIESIGKNYWVASRIVAKDSVSSTFFVRAIGTNGNLDYDYICEVRDNDKIRSSSRTYGFRPVFTLKSSVKIKGGNGTSSDPYTLGL